MEQKGTETWFLVTSCFSFYSFFGAFKDKKESLPLFLFSATAKNKLNGRHLARLAVVQGHQARAEWAQNQR